MTKHPAGPTGVEAWWDERVWLVPGCLLRILSTVTEVDPPLLLGKNFSTRRFSGHFTYSLTVHGER